MIRKMYKGNQMGQQSVLDSLSILKKATADEIADNINQCTAGVYRCLHKLRATKDVEFAGMRIGKNNRSARYWKVRDENGK